MFFCFFLTVLLWFTLFCVCVYIQWKTALNIFGSSEASRVGRTVIKEKAVIKITSGKGLILQKQEVNHKYEKKNQSSGTLLAFYHFVYLLGIWLRAFQPQMVFFGRVRLYSQSVSNESSHHHLLTIDNLFHTAGQHSQSVSFKCDHTNPKIILY